MSVYEPCVCVVWTLSTKAAEVQGTGAPVTAYLHITENHFELFGSNLSHVSSERSHNRLTPYRALRTAQSIRRHAIYNPALPSLFLPLENSDYDTSDDESINVLELSKRSLPCYIGPIPNFEDVHPRRSVQKIFAFRPR